MGHAVSEIATAMSSEKPYGNSADAGEVGIVISSAANAIVDGSVLNEAVAIVSIPRRAIDRTRRIATY